MMLEATEIKAQIKVLGEPYSELPKDLYIPPDALEVFLETFEGPLDLLWYLIRQQDFDILNIPIATITQQYMEYMDLMQELRFELAAEYLVMAAMLAEIKSRLLLPVMKNAAAEEVDPRAELVNRLLEYEQLKKAASLLDDLPQQGRDVFAVSVTIPDKFIEKPLPNIELSELVKAMQAIWQRAKLVAHHHIQREPLSVRERMAQILVTINQENKGIIAFGDLLIASEGRMGVVVSFIAILELLKQSLIDIVQSEPYSQIEIRAVTT